MTPEPTPYATRSEKRRDFVIGVLIFIGLNILLSALSVVPVWLAQVFPQANDAFAYLLIGSYCLPWLANGAAILYFLMRRRWIAFGMLAAIGVLLLCVLVAGVLFAAFCLYMQGQGV